jgi:hypothetical protein
MTVSTLAVSPDLTTRLVSGILSIEPVWAIAKKQARSMMIKRAERLGIPLRETVHQLQNHDWQSDWPTIHNPDLDYPNYYQASFHGYDQGHLCWDAAFEFEVAANAVHSSLYPEAGAKGDHFFKHVPEMRSQYGSLYPASYYRLKEAYDLKQQIEAEDKRRESYFSNFDVRLVDELSLDHNIDSGNAPTTIGLQREEDKPDTEMTVEERQEKQDSNSQF